MVTRRRTGAARPGHPTERELEDALAAAADEAGSTLVRTHYLPLLGGTAELVVQPSEPESASRKLIELLGPLGHENRPYLVTVVNGAGDALLVLGWTPHIEGCDRPGHRVGGTGVRLGRDRRQAGDTRRHQR